MRVMAVVVVVADNFVDVVDVDVLEVSSFLEPVIP